MRPFTSPSSRISRRSCCATTTANSPTVRSDFRSGGIRISAGGRRTRLRGITRRLAEATITAQVGPFHLGCASVSSLGTRAARVNMPSFARHAAHALTKPAPTVTTGRHLRGPKRRSLPVLSRTTILTGKDRDQCYESSMSGSSDRQHGRDLPGNGRTGEARNRKKAQIYWTFTIAAARRKLKKVYLSVGG